MALDRHTSTALPPAQPAYILRGHASQIHSVKFLRKNTRLLTGDADGWVVFWKVETKRALAVWKAHDAAILGMAAWGRDKIITHGRDNNLRIWQLRSSDEPSLSKILPAEDTTTPRPKPWLLHTLPVNTLNFCAFSMCHDIYSESEHDGPQASRATRQSDSILIAVPARDDKKAEVYQFPEEKLKFVIPRAQSADTGMVMALKLAQQPATRDTVLLVGYEGGLTAAFRLPQARDQSLLGVAEVIYLSQPHSQPILSLDISPDGKTFFTSAADAVIAAHRIPELSSNVGDGGGAITSETSDQRRPNINDTISTSRKKSSTPPPSVQESVHVQDGVAHGAGTTSTVIGSEAPQDTDANLTFAKRSIPASRPTGAISGGLSSLLSSSASKPSPISKTPKPFAPVTAQAPHKSTDTKHAGQQSLCVRSDGRIFVTGGWDSRIRIYSAKTLKEVAVLKWHKEGVYAADFGTILETTDLEESGLEEHNEGPGLVKRDTGLAKLQRQREEQLQLKHWVVAGAKDGKVSLWEVF